MSLVFVVSTKVAILADTLGIHGPVKVVAFIGHLSATLGMVTILAHAVCIVRLAGMRAL